jgi:NAD(P)-dependent dehydrogenase (short-subunit alcohol dehydrogenase family)
MASYRNSRVALITGGDKQTGYELAQALGVSGFAIVLGAEDLDDGEAVARQLRDEGIAATVLRLDITDEGDRLAVCQHLLTKHGQLDVLLNNAGRSSDFLDLLQRCEPGGLRGKEQFLRAIYERDFFAPLLLTELLMPLIEAAAKGRIVNVSTALEVSLSDRDEPPPHCGLHASGINTSNIAMQSLTDYLDLGLDRSDVLVIPVRHRCYG